MAVMQSAGRWKNREEEAQEGWSLEAIGGYGDKRESTGQSQTCSLKERVQIRKTGKA
jgi:hypothetical protein